MNLKKVVNTWLDRLQYRVLKKRDPFVAQHFIGSSFKDKLYNHDNQSREKAAIWKLTKTPNIWILAHHTFNWVAIGIPLNLADKNQPEGDIDLMIAMTKLQRDENGNRPIVYRIFEVKTSKVNRNGHSTSLKQEKFYRVLGQLKKLRNFGAQQIFLLEIYIAQAGFRLKATVPPKIDNSIIQKSNGMSGTECGYAVCFLEHIAGLNEDTSVVGYEPVNIRPAPLLSMKQPFIDLIRHIEEFSKNKDAPGRGWLISYCYKCHELIKPGHEPVPTCPICKKGLVA